MTQPWALRAARLFDGAALHHGSPLVVIREGSVVAVDLSGAHPAHDLPVVDLGEATLLPGLVDAHTHLGFEPGALDPRPLRADDVEAREALAARMRRHAEQALRAGVTTVRDLGDWDYLALEIRDGFAAGGGLGPEILASGPPITSTGGHCWFLGGEADSPEELRAAVAERVDRGVDVVKVMATGGGITPGSAPYESQYDVERLRVVVEAAHSAQMMVTAHAHGTGGIADAVYAGVDGVEHGTFMTADGAVADWDVVRVMAERGVYVGVTAGRVLGGAPLSPRVIAARKLLPRMREEGVRLVCSSDAGVVVEKPHDCLPYGLEEFRSFVDISPVEVLATVTGLAADSCGVGDRKGRVRAGSDADFVAVSGDPGEDLGALRSVVAVYRAGQRVEL
ncbi:amidohydrolase family protein [Amycolatopsis sp. NPDC058986]|uniref:metal-dependent hydrolase family protein n=1 Tax=unclassified Amycolatopsis TaxID=2618356 RepID=UPI00366BCD53